MKLPALTAFSAALLSIGLAGCGPTEPAAPAAPAPDANAVTSTLTTSPEITAADIGARIKELADDKYEGRGPGDPEGEKRGRLDRRRDEAHRPRARAIRTAPTSRS